MIRACQSVDRQALLKRLLSKYVKIILHNSMKFNFAGGYADNICHPVNRLSVSIPAMYE